ncbi:MAG: 4-(cytidine 5'-diphospho)-2-C-methyl-D-erythritol kinase, partial [Burkholderiales bacterium]|nr:4-(cytidine 5'-diphospho)-2-C-methyl-D-erythritol kinase [Burkholderiales bacterium]
SGVVQGVRVVVRKSIPVQAGLGGGSSDAAAALLGGNHIWGLNWPRDRLVELARGLGSDVPLFLAGGVALGTGRGDQL